MRRLSIGLLTLLCTGLHAQEFPTDTAAAFTGAGVIDVALMVENESYAEAERLIDSLLVSQPDNDALHFFKGSCSLAQGRLEDAASETLAALEADSCNTAYYEQLADIYYSTGTQESVYKADSLYVTLAKRFGGKYRNPYTLSAMARQELDTMNDSLAQRHFEEALAMDGEYAVALAGLASIHQMNGNFVAYLGTMERFARVRNIHPEAKSAYINHFLEDIDGPTWRIFGKQIDGVVDAMAQTNPTDSATLSLAGRWFYSLGQKDKGRGYFKQWRDSAPDNLNAEILWISLIMNDGTDEDVINECDYALKRFRNPADQVQLLCIKADRLYQSGKKNKAFRIYDKALRLEPDNLMVLNNYAYFLSLEQKHLRKALKMSEKTIEAEPENVSYLDTYGFLLYLSGRPADAKPYFKKAIIYGGKEDTAVLYHYYLVLDALGEKSLATYYKGLYESKAATEAK